MTPAEVDRYTRRRPLQPLGYRYDRYDRYSTVTQSTNQGPPESPTSVQTQQFQLGPKQWVAKTQMLSQHNVCPMRRAEGRLWRCVVHERRGDRDKLQYCRRKRSRISDIQGELQLERPFRGVDFCM